MPSTRPTKNSSAHAYTPRRTPPWVIRDYAWGIRDHLWEYDIVERIRQGLAVDVISHRDLVVDEYPFSALGWEAAEKNSAKANRLHSAYLDDASIAKRAAKRELLRQQMEENKAAWQAYNEGNGPRPTWENPATEEQRKRAAAQHKRQLDAEREAREAPIRAERAERQAKERIELDRMLAAMNKRSPDEVPKFLAEEARILDSKWSCMVCDGKSYIERKRPGYQLTCIGCGKQAWGSHKSLWEVLNR